uniref:Uncharacterized protein n=1 Tax=Chrysotila carterae TaxID=13221 RepID=A0A7S4BKD4_CHRCT
MRASVPVCACACAVPLRSRRVTPSLRRLLFRALAPSLLGCPLSALPPLSEKAEAAEWEKAYAAFGASVSRGKSAGSLPFGFGLLVGGSGPPPDALTTALSRALSSGGGSPLLNGLAYKAAAGDTEADAAAVAAVVAAAIEPTAALVGAMLVRAQVSSSEWGAKLSSEQKTALSGVAPDAAISAEALSAMPKLDEFAKEVLRTAPPTRPPALRLKAPAVIGGVSVPQGALVMRESYLSNFLGDVYSQPLAFEPERFSAERREPFPLGFACERGESSAEAEQLLLDVAKATFVQIRRMFSVKLSVDVPEASGFPVRALPDEYEMLVEAGMFYELKRETKRLNF